MSLTLKGALNAEWYTLDGQDGDDNPARVKLKPLNGEQVDRVMEGAILEGSGAGLSSRGVKSALRDGITDWENILDENGTDIECKFTNHQWLSWSSRSELATVIINRSNLNEEDQKN